MVLTLIAYSGCARCGWWWTANRPAHGGLVPVP